jgi:hypothetical protein
MVVEAFFAKNAGGNLSFDYRNFWGGGLIWIKRGSGFGN